MKSIGSGRTASNGAMTLDGRRPTLALVPQMDEVHLHRPQSPRRSGVWNPASWRTG
ncbi:hypothetical protein [Streptomyces sp. NPDC060002]|uniref:hypothetical protein n=1 Tax=Streptomyces sp. NPDC060002 TaxID=3347033 RepID=UPI00367B6407